MPRIAEKAIIIGIDSLMLSLVDRFRQAGRLPHFRRLIESGSSMLAWPSMPTFTPPNWTTIATGTDPRVHGIHGWQFMSTDCRAEHLWTSAARAGKRSITLRYPCSYPPTVETNIAVEAGLPNSTPWQLAPSVAYSRPKLSRYSGGFHGTFDSVEVAFHEPDGWVKMLRSSPPPQAATIEIAPTPGKGKPVALHLLATAEDGSGYSRLLICREHDASRPVCSLRVGEWSEFITDEFDTDDGRVSAAYRVKLVKMASDLSEFVLYRTHVYPLSGFSSPPEVAGRMVEALGPYLDNTPRTALAHGWHDTYFEELDYHVGWLGRGAQWLMDNYEWSIYWTQCHSPDYIKHECWGRIDPVSPGYRPERADEFWEIFARDYEAMDRLVADVSARADDHTLVVVVSDHGHFAARRSVYLSHALRDAGLLVIDGDGKVDCTRSKVRGFEHDGVLINHVGRYPDGCVSEADLPAVREELAAAMAGLRDPETGGRIYQLLLDPDQAGPLGVDDSAGDLITAARPGYLVVGHPSAVTPSEGRGYVAAPDPKYGMWGGAESIHDGLPSGSLSIGSNCATFIIAGPGVRRNYRRPWPIWLRDVAPTLAWALGVPAPAQATGQPVVDAFEQG